MLAPAKIRRQDVQHSLPTRRPDQNKSHGGRCLVVAGSEKFAGAAILTATAAARSGAGYVTIAMPHRLILQKSSFEYPDFLLRRFDQGLVKELVSPSKALWTAVAIGPGLGAAPRVRTLTWRLIRILSTESHVTRLPVVLDADALNSVAQFYKPKDGRFPKSWILTPHEAELGRLLQVTAKQVQADREKYLRIALAKFGCIIVLKGDQTLVGFGKKVWRNTTGNSALAKAGTGDVLTGILSGFLSQNVPPLEATKLAVYLHGAIADRWVQTGHDHLSLMASDIVQDLPKAIARLRRAK